MSVEKIFQQRFELKESVQFRIKRYNPEKEERAYFENYSVRASESTTVLEGLLLIHETESPSLQIRYSCRMAICGSCGMLINGLPRLACNTRILGLKSKTITIEPLSNFPVVRDLVTGMSGLFAKHKSIKPYLIRKDTAEQENPTKEFRQPEQDWTVTPSTHIALLAACVWQLVPRPPLTYFSLVHSQWDKCTDIMQIPGTKVQLKGKLSWIPNMASGVVTLQDLALMCARRV